jgi:hypothetical protein
MDASVISAAAGSTLGILALLILVLSGLATAFFRKAPTRVRVGIFLLMFFAAALFGVAALMQQNPKKPPATPPASTGPPPAAQTPSTGTTPPPPVATINSPEGQLLPDSSDRLIAPQELANLSVADLRIARNEIYARHGYIFQSEDLRAHFSALPWYRPTGGAPTFSAIEQQNIAAIRQVEAARAGG